MMKSEDIQTFAALGRALWPDANEGEPIAVEVLSAVALLDLNEEARTERAAKVLLEKAMRAFKPETRRLDLLFYRMDPRARFLLVAVQVARWSYERAARVLGVTPIEIERELWATRLALASESGSVLRTYPVGTAVGSGTHCPEYVLDRPWTQRFLDEEIPSGRERVFLQNHLMACDACQRALSRCRDVYYSVDKMIPRLDSGKREDRQYISALQGLERQGRLHVGGRSEITFIESLSSFLSRRDAKFIFLGIAAYVAFLIFRK